MSSSSSIWTVPHRQLYIDGDWKDPILNKRLPVINPSTEDTIVGDIPAATSEDVELAVTAARRALVRNKGKDWARASGAHRAKYLRSIAAKIVERKSELAKLEALDCGKPLDEAAWDMDDVAGCFEYYADLAEALDKKQKIPISLPMDTFKCHVLKEPIGVVGLITPWSPFEVKERVEAVPVSEGVDCGGFFELCAVFYGAGISCGERWLLEQSPSGRESSYRTRGVSEALPGSPPRLREVGVAGVGSERVALGSKEEAEEEASKVYVYSPRWDKGSEVGFLAGPSTLKGRFKDFISQAMFEEAFGEGSASRRGAACLFWRDRGDVGSWIVKFTRALNEVEGEAFLELMEVLQPRGVESGRRDEAVWRMSRATGFTVKKGYEWMRRDQPISAITAVRWAWGRLKDASGMDVVFQDVEGMWSAGQRLRRVGDRSVKAKVSQLNYPLLMAVWKVAPALAAGCIAILKPSELASVTCLELADICKEVGLPPGVLNILTGLGSEAGAPLASHTLIDKISFTGSTETGRKIMTAAAQVVKPVSLELGGKSPIIVFEDVDLDKGVCHVVLCLIHESISVEFLDKLVAWIKGMKVSDPLEEGCRLGPVVSEGQYDKIKKFISTAETEGARVLCGGSRPEHLKKGFFIEPTIITNVDTSMQIWREEVFGPVLCVKTFRTEDEAVELANDTQYGLAAAVISNNRERCNRIAEEFQAGIIWVNCSQPCFCQAPWGGTKRSGFGRELGEWGLDNYLSVKQVTEYISNEPWGWYTSPSKL
ncbi:hypothetical protein QJS04_geneDACA015192 [Acorus gramineus]|uniref:Aldehyde dehydrogenase domain-containing protein n=1 Tax=Acorus gramineus TaxID=55184 RepID=A0AAV9BAJ8_ACOGR|nr:hypothetical protein QJS04_geneDACA015192 [Acorus gramineus]